MRGKMLVILVVLGGFLLSSGCSDLLGPPGSSSDATAKPTPPPNPKYGIGDVVIQNPNDLAGVIVQNYDPVKRTYSTRSVILDDYGHVSYYEGGGTKSFSLQDFETQYPYKWGNVDNPYNLPTMEKEYKNKYSVGKVVTKKNEPLEGIKILTYDYPSDSYTYQYVYKQGSTWVPVDDITYTGARTDVEERFVEQKT